MSLATPVRVDPVADSLRAEAPRLTALWRAEARVVDRLPELLAGLAAYLEGDIVAADRGFAALVLDDPLQRLGVSVTLERLLEDAAALRALLARELPGSLDRVHAGLDRALARPLQQCAARREAVTERLASILGHDLRGPLATATMSAELLRAGSPDLANVADRIMRVTERMRRMIDDTLDFARGQLGGGIPLTPHDDDLGHIAGLAVDETRGAVSDRDITFAAAGNLRAPLDRERCAQAITYLTTNAIEHGTGPVEVRAAETPDRRHVACSVTCHGAAIAAERLPRIFDPLAHEVDKRRGSGLGLELYIVYLIALAHGGSCDVASDATATTFTLRFPRPGG